MIDGWSISYKIAFKWMPMDLTDGKSTWVQVMVWCHQATSHYLSQCWPRSLSPYGVIRPQWVKTPRTVNSGVNPYCFIQGWNVLHENIAKFTISLLYHWYNQDTIRSLTWYRSKVWLCTILPACWPSVGQPEMPGYYWSFGNTAGLSILAWNVQPSVYWFENKRQNFCISLLQIKISWKT